ncbi:hypothetical protein ZOSMA_118G00500 [Zostera marina]|uniref:Uncharacterized protein n=1 Tax=Zostera marina TaxID=29655 RepID=A0A0K9Q3Z4_ZOSMR|nr:hypothetical protein ZOSMA_118G00500 [Zostera marina]
METGSFYMSRFDWVREHTPSFSCISVNCYG